MKRITPSDEADNSVVLAKLCRLGRYREAARQALRTYREAGNISKTLGLSLAKTGRHKLSIVFSLLATIEKKEAEGHHVNVITEALGNYTPTIEEIRIAIAATSAVRLSPEYLAAIGSRIEDPPTCEFLFKEYTSYHHYSNDEVSLTKALVAKIHGNHVEALSIAQDLAARNVLLLQSCKLAAEILLLHEYTYQAQRYACLALSRNANSIPALEILGLCLYKRARWRAARKIFGKIHETTKDDISLLNSVITLPILNLSSRSLMEAIGGFNDLEKIMQNKPKLLGLANSLERCKAPLPSEFYLAYEGPVSIRHNLEVVRNFQRLSASSLVEEIKSYHTTPKSLIPEQKIRIGFISRFFSHHSNLEAHYGLITSLNKEKFNVIVIHRFGATQDASHHALNSEVDRVIYLKEEMGESCALIATLSLDILFFTDLGMNSFDCILAMPHLARYQITSWGLPHTTGVKEIDFYLRSSIFSDCEDQSEYTEKLVDLDGYIGYFSHPSEGPSNALRDYFILPPDRFLIGCLQSIHKIHPDFDEYLEEIAKIDQSILIILSPSHGDQLMESFIGRIKNSAPTAYQQLCIVQRTSASDFMSLNAILDLNLDTIYYGAGISFIQTAWCGPPYITENSNLLRASAVSRSYRFCEISDPPIAANKKEYIELVRYYFTHRLELSKLRKEIQVKAEGKIYKDKTFVLSCEKFFQDLCSANG